MMTVSEIMEAHAHVAGQGVGARRVMALLDVIAEAAERHSHVMPMSVSAAIMMLRHALIYGYGPDKMIVEVGHSPLARADPSGISGPPGRSWLCWRSRQDRERAQAMRDARISQLEAELSTLRST